MLSATTAVLCLFAVSGCSAGTSSPASRQSTPTSASAGAPTSSTTTPTTLPVAGPVRNLVADTTVRQQLMAAFIAARSQPTDTWAAIPAAAIGGIEPGSLYYAYVPSTNTFWAMASFYPTPGTEQTSAFIGFQDGGNSAQFARSDDGPWAVKYIGPCYTALPPEVQAAWGLGKNPYPGC